MREQNDQVNKVESARSIDRAGGSTGAGEIRGSEGMGCRESGRSALLNRVHRMRREADKLEALAMAIPANFPLDADEGLWSLAIGTTTRGL